MAQGDHLYNCYSPPEQEFVRGEGAYLYTENGDKYLDFIAGISVNCLGHAHPVPVNALKEQSEKVWHLSGMFQLTGAKTLAKKYCDALPFAEKVFFTNSGAEAIECAMKTARKYHYDNGQPERYEIITPFTDGPSRRLMRAAILTTLKALVPIFRVSSTYHLAIMTL